MVKYYFGGECYDTMREAREMAKATLEKGNRGYIYSVNFRHNYAPYAYRVVTASNNGGVVIFNGGVSCFKTDIKGLN